MPDVPSYARQTMTSEKHSRKNEESEETELFILPQVRSMGDMTNSSYMSDGLDGESYLDTSQYVS